MTPTQLPIFPRPAAGKQSDADLVRAHAEKVKRQRADELRRHVNDKEQKRGRR
jgi:hypothetical protein